MDTNLTNQVTAVGTYNGLPTSVTSEAVVVALVSGIRITKTADKTSWADGVLTYTITIDNQAANTYTAPIITDIIDTTLVNFITDSVIIDGVKAAESQYQYNTDTHTLTINLADITPTKSSSVQFQVTKKV